MNDVNKDSVMGIVIILWLVNKNFFVVCCFFLVKVWYILMIVDRSNIILKIVKFIVLNCIFCFIV